MEKNNYAKVSLIVAMLFCAMFAIFRLSGFVISRFPPYYEGECFISPSLYGVQMKVLKNNLTDATSIIEVSRFGYSIITSAQFGELREVVTQKVRCL